MKLFEIRDGLYACEAHVQLFFDPDYPPCEIDEEEWRDRGCGDCEVCKTPPIEGRKCEYCQKPLHPQWFAVYCSNRCALRDSQ